MKKLWRLPVIHRKIFRSRIPALADFELKLKDPGQFNWMLLKL